VNANEITDAVRRKAIIAAANIAGACLTDDQIRLLASAFAGKSEREIVAIFGAVLPEQHDRTGILLPYMVAGPFASFASRAHDIAVHLVASFWNPQQRGTVEDVSQAQLATGSGNQMMAIGAARMLSGEAVASATGKAWSPARARQFGDETGPRALWNLVGLAPAMLSVGFTGMDELKGNLPEAHGANPGIRGYRDNPTSGRGSGLGQANQQAEDWLLEKGEPSF
jgi:hypothetical protein